MKIDAVRKLTKKRIADLGLSDRKYAENLKMTQNNIYLFLAGKGAYANTVPKAVLIDLDLKAETTTNYYKNTEAGK